MQPRKIVGNIVSKSPKILLILVVLFGLSLSRNSLWGSPVKVEENTDLESIAELCEKQCAQKVTLSSRDQIVFEIKDAQGHSLGQVLSSTPLSGVRRGYAGRTPIVIFVDKDRKISSVQMLPNNETRSFTATLKRNNFFDSWTGQSIDEPINQPDAVTGVTMTSSSVIANMVATLDYTNKVKKEQANPADWASILPQIAIMVVVLLSLACYFYPGKTRRLRLPVLVLSIGVLGIWQGAFVSVDLMYKFMINGVSFGQRFALVTILALAVLIPILFSRSWYCTYLCPFGAIQELVGKVYSRKIRLSAGVLNVFKWIRQMLLLTIIALLFLVPTFDPSQVEPFTVFMVCSAAISVIVIALVSIISSVFIQRAWCKLLCPTGEILSMLQRKGK